jgi:tetratricopeptide (TPR) repeat protein
VQCKYNVYKKYKHTFYIQKLLDEDIKELIRKKKFFQAIKYVKLLSYKGRRWFLLAKLYEKLGKRDKSLVYYRKVVSYNPFSYYGIVARMILYKRGIKNFRYRSIYEEAKKEYKRAIKRHKYMLLAFFKRNNVIFKVRKDATKKIFFALMKNNL